MGSAVHTLTGSQDLIMKFFVALLFVGLAFAEPKSEATAEADADPEAWYGHYYGYPGYYGGYGRYGGYGGRYYGGYGGYYGRKKRDAEADPAVLASTSAVTTPQVYTHPYTYGFPYAHHVAAAPITYTHPVAHAPLTYTHGLTYAPHYPYAYGLHYPYAMTAPKKPAV